MPRKASAEQEIDSADEMFNHNITVNLKPVGKAKTVFQPYADMVEVCGVTTDDGRFHEGFCVGEGEACVLHTRIPIKDCYELGVKLKSAPRARLQFKPDPNLALDHDFHVEPFAFDDGHGNACLVARVYGRHLPIHKGAKGLVYVNSL